MPFDLIAMADKPTTAPSSAAVRARLDLAVKRNETVRRIAAEAQDHFERTRLEDKRPTAQTERKLRRDVVDEAHRAGKLTDEQRQAAEEIEWVCTVESGGLRAKTSNYEPAGGGGGSTTAPSQSFTEAAIRFRAFRVYLAGQSYVAPMPIFNNRGIQVGERPEIKAVRGRRPVVVDLVLDLIIGNARLPDADGVCSVTTLSLREAEDKYRLRHGTGLTVLRYGLAVYCWRAGWDAEANFKIVCACEAQWAIDRRKRSSYGRTINRRGV